MNYEILVSQLLQFQSLNCSLFGRNTICMLTMCELERERERERERSYVSMCVCKPEWEITSAKETAVVEREIVSRGSMKHLLTVLVRSLFLLLLFFKNVFFSTTGGWRTFSVTYPRGVDGMMGNQRMLISWNNSSFSVVREFIKYTGSVCYSRDICSDFHHSVL